MFMHPQKPNPRTEYREQATERIAAASTLAEQYPDLDSLSASLTYFAPDGGFQTRAIKYTFNLAHAKSLFCFECSNQECVEGDFDLTVELARAVAAHRSTLSGEVVCQGWRSRNTMGLEHCHHILRYKLSLGYKQPATQGCK